MFLLACLGSNKTCGTLCGMVRINPRLLCFISVARKSLSLSVTSAHEKRFIDPKIGIGDMKQVFFSLLCIAFYHCTL